jgi:hypothetical protein
MALATCRSRGSPYADSPASKCHNLRPSNSVVLFKLSKIIDSDRPFHQIGWRALEEAEDPVAVAAEQLSQ